MAKVIYQDATPINYGPYYDPFVNDFNSTVGYKKKTTDKYVREGKYDAEKEEIELEIEDNPTVTVNLKPLEDKYATKGEISGLTEDTYVTSGSSVITEHEQTLTLDIGNTKGEKSKVNINLSGLNSTYTTKTELSEKLKWGDF